MCFDGKTEIVIAYVLGSKRFGKAVKSTNISNYIEIKKKIYEILTNTPKFMLVTELLDKMESGVYVYEFISKYKNVSRCIG